MTKEERGKLLVDQEDTQNEIAELEKQLQDYGSYLASLGHSLRNGPASTRFSNVPTEIGDQPRQSASSSFDWNKYPDRETVVRLTRKLQNKKDALKEFEAALKSAA